MRSNFRPNIRLATNILLVIGTFAIALKIAPIAMLYQEKNLCIKYLKHQIDRDKLIKRLKIVKQANPNNTEWLDELINQIEDMKNNISKSA